MALKFFIFCLILTPFLLVDNDMVKEIVKESIEEVAQVSFTNATLSELNTLNVDKIIQADKVNKYENKEELENAFFRVRNANNNSDTIKARYLKHENEIYLFRNDVVLKRDNDLELKTDELIYNIKDGIATNHAPFTFKYKNSIFSGENLYLSRNDYAISGDRVHFRINKKDF